MKGNVLDFSYKIKDFLYIELYFFLHVWLVFVEETKRQRGMMQAQDLHGTLTQNFLKIKLKVNQDCSCWSKQVLLLFCFCVWWLSCRLYNRQGRVENETRFSMIFIVTGARSGFLESGPFYFSHTATQHHVWKKK